MSFDGEMSYADNERGSDSAEVASNATAGIQALKSGDKVAAERYLQECYKLISGDVELQNLEIAEGFAELFMREIDSDIGHKLLEKVREQMERSEK